MSKAKRAWRWVSRDIERQYSDSSKMVVVWRSEIPPDLSNGVFNHHFSGCIVICYDVWLETTGMKIKPGDCKKVQFDCCFVKDEA